MHFLEIRGSGATSPDAQTDTSGVPAAYDSDIPGRRSGSGTAVNDLQKRSEPRTYFLVAA